MQGFAWRYGMLKATRHKDIIEILGVPSWLAMLSGYLKPNKNVAETGFVINTMIRGENRYEIK